MVGVTPYNGNADTETFIRDVEAALVAEFGRRAVTRGKIAFRVRESRLTLPADVVPCFSYRLIYGRNLDGSPRYQPGHCVFPQGENRIENYPQQQYDNGVARNNQTGYRYKHLVRILKRLENELVDHGLVGKLPSYLLECLVFNVPPDAFGYPNYTDDLRAAYNPS
jgi:hypothetical protein